MRRKIIIVTTILINSFYIFAFAQNETISEIENSKTTQENTDKNSFNTNLLFGDDSQVSDINVPKLDNGWFEWDEPIILVKEIIYKIIEILPFVIFVMLLLWCFHMIVSIKDWEWKKWARIIKQVIVWTILFIISIYILNIVSIYLTWYPVININRIIHPYMWTNYEL